MKVKKITAVALAGLMSASMALTGCGSSIDSDAVAATCGDVELSLGYLNFAAHYMQVTYDSFFAAYYGDDYWTSEDYADDDGNTMEDTVKEYVLEDVELCLLLEAHMDDYGVEITEEDMEAISAAAAEFMEENDAKTIKAMGATQEIVELYLYYETVCSLMTDAIYATAEGQLDIADYTRRTFSYVEIDTAGYYDDDSEYVEYTDEEIEALLATAEAIALTGIEDLETAADTYGYDVSTYSYGTDEDSEEDGGFCDAVIAAAEAMSEGDVSGVIEGTDCYYIIRLDSEDDEDAQQDAYDSAMSDLEDEIYDEVTEAYYEESDFTVDEDLWAQVQFTVIFSITDDEDEDTSADE